MTRDSPSTPVSSKKSTFNINKSSKLTVTTIDTKDYEFSFESLFDNPDIKQVFQQYLESTHNAEPLLFMNEVEVFVSKKSAKNRHTHAKHLIKTFVEPFAKHEINISKHQRQQVIDTFRERCSEEECPKTLFESLVATVFLELKEDTFAKFTTSAIFQQYVQKRVEESGNSAFLDEIATRKRNVSNSSSSSSTDRKPRSSVSDKYSDTASDILTMNELICPMDVSHPFIFDEYFDWLKNELDMEPDVVNQWEQVKTRDKKTLGRRLFLSKNVHSLRETDKSKRLLRKIREEVVLPYSIHECIYAFIDSDRQFDVEELLSANDFVEYHGISDTNSNASAVTRTVYKCPWPMSNRDFVISFSLRREDNRYILVRKSCETAAAGKGKSCVRGEVVGGVIFERIDDNTTRYKNLFMMDFHGWFPLSFWQSVLKWRDEAFVVGLVKSIEVRRSKQNCSHGGSTFPPLGTESHYIYQTLLDWEKSQDVNKEIESNENQSL
jgi:hypothetical protein